MKIPGENFENCLEIPSGGFPSDFFIQIPAERGIILFADSAGKPIQLLTAASLRRVARSRLLADTRVSQGRRADIKTVTAKIYYTRCYCEFRSLLACYKAARQIFGADYKDHISLGRMWYLKIDPKAKWPHFSIVERPKGGYSEKIFGPFVTRKSALQLAGELEEAFGLCKKVDYLTNPQKAKSCPYLQMGVCSGVCASRISRQEYLKKIESSLAAIENYPETKKQLTCLMQNLSRDLEFEKAQWIKRRMERLSILQKEDYRWIAQIDSIEIIHIDASGKIKLPGQRKMAQTYSAFLIDANGIKDFGDFVIEDLPKIFKLIQKARHRKGKLSYEELSDLFQLAGFYLYRSNSPGLWADAKTIESHDQLAKMMTQRM